MDIRRTYNNSNMEKKRNQLIRQQEAANLLIQAKKTFAPKPNRIDESLKIANSDKSERKTWKEDRLVALFESLPKDLRGYLARLLKVVEKETDFFEDERINFKLLEACREMAYWGDFWVKQPEEWVCRTHNIRRQFSGLLHHLLAKYKVPLFMDAAFYDNPNRKHQEWFIHIGSGQNIRTASGLPFQMTKAMAHSFLEVPSDFKILEAFRYVHIQSLGGSKNLINAWLESPLAVDFNNKEFWDSVVRFFIDNPMLDPSKIAPIIDYINNQRYVDVIEITPDGDRVHHGPPQPNLTMKGRNPETLLAQVDQWHTHTARSKKNPFLQWASCGVAGGRFEEGAGNGKKVFSIVELLNSNELKEEGKEMCHCVGSYSDSCSSGRCAVFSLRQVEGDGIGRKATISVNLNPNKVLNEARGKRNDVLSQNISRLVRSWANARSITISSWARI